MLKSCKVDWQRLPGAVSMRSNHLRMERNRALSCRQQSGRRCKVLSIRTDTRFNRNFKLGIATLVLSLIGVAKKSASKIVLSVEFQILVFKFQLLIDMFSNPIPIGGLCLSYLFCIGAKSVSVVNFDWRNKINFRFGEQFQSESRRVLVGNCVARLYDWRRKKAREPNCSECWVSDFGFKFSF